MLAKKLLRASMLSFLVLGLMVPCGCVFRNVKKDEVTIEKEYAMDEAELQSHVMSFADRFVAILVAAFRDYDALEPSAEERYPVMSTLTYSMSNAYIIAGESDPGVALLDMLSMVILGRIILEEEELSTYGKSIEPIVDGFRKAEKDIFQIATGVLTVEQLDNLIAIVRRWRKQNPEVTFFPFIRFANFAADRRESKLTKAEEPEGIFETVETATEQVEEIRLLAERGMYLATRMPQLTGSFSQIWLAALIGNPDVTRFMADFLLIAETTARLAKVAEEFPELIAAERRATIEQAMISIRKERGEAITQFMSELSAERKAAMHDLLAEEQRVRGLLTDLRQTLETGNELILSANALTAPFGSGAPSGQAETVGMKDYQMALAELSKTAQEFRKLAVSLERFSANVDVDNLIPQIIRAMDRAEDEGEELVDHTMRQLIVIIGIWLVGYVIARLIVMYVQNRTCVSRD